MARCDLATWVGPSVNSGDGDGHPGESADAMASVRGLVVHIAQGTYAGTIAWERNPGADVSSHFVLARHGGLAQMVDTHDRSWCQRAGNGDWLSVECEGKLPQSLTGAQRERLAELLVWVHRTYPAVPLATTSSPSGRGLGYHSMGGPSWGHLACPGSAIIGQLPGVVTRAREILEGEDMDPREVWTVKYKEYADESGDGERDFRTTADILYATHAAAVQAQADLAGLETQVAALTAAVQALATSGTSVDTGAIVAAVQAQGAATREAVLARLAAAGVALGG